MTAYLALRKSNSPGLAGLFSRYTRWRLHTQFPQCGVVVGNHVGAHWPEPVVDLPTATRTAKALLHARRNTPQVREGKQAIIEQHASRRATQPTQRRRADPAIKDTQIQWDF